MTIIVITRTSFTLFFVSLVLNLKKTDSTFLKKRNFYNSCCQIKNEDKCCVLKLFKSEKNRENAISDINSRGATKKRVYGTVRFFSFTWNEIIDSDGRL